MTGADAVAQILKREGTEYLFCFPTTPIIEACARVGIRPIITRTERTLINMADGYSRVSNGNRLGVCAVQYGPGLENAFGGIAQAYADSSPILVLPLTEYQTFADTKPAFGAVEHFRGITKWVGMVNHRDRLPQFMRRAFTLLRTGHGAPVVVEIPRELATGQYPSNELDYEPVPAMRTMADPDSIESAADLLAAARRPCIIAGQGVLYATATDELVELAEMLETPVATTLMAKSAFPETHPLSLGVANRSDNIAGRFLDCSDVILAIGASLSEGLMLAPLPQDKKLIHSTVNEYDIGKSYPAAVPLLGDAGLVTGQLLDALRERLSDRDEYPRTYVRREMQAEKQAQLHEWLPVFTSDDQPIRPYRIMWDLNNLVDRDNTIVTHDSGMPRSQLVFTYQATAPRGYIGWGNSTQLGTGLGLAMGAKLAEPEKLVVNVMGDAAFGMAGMDIESAARLRIPVLTIILNNSIMGGHDRVMPVATENYGSAYLSGDYAAVAADLGAYSEKVSDPGEIIPALKRGIGKTREGVPAVLEFITAHER